MQSSVEMQKGAQIFKRGWEEGPQANYRKDRKVNIQEASASQAVGLKPML